MAGKTIRLFLVDGLPTSVLTAEIINWTGKVLVAPRSQLASLAKRDEVKRTGIYCLVGPDPESPHRDRVYIGEGDTCIAAGNRNGRLTWKTETTGQSYADWQAANLAAAEEKGQAIES